MSKVVYDDSYNPIQEYWESFEQNGGSEVVGDKIYRTYKKIIFDLECKVSNYYYSSERGNHILEFMENYCRHSKGKMGGRRIVLELWEKAMLATIFGFIDIEGIRKYHRAVLIIGKKNGKSLIASGVALYLQIADGEPGPEVYAVATKKDQAKIIWQESKRMIKKSPALLRRIKPLTHELSSEDFNDGIFKPLASDSDTLDGLNVHGVLMDEFHQWKNGRPLYDIMADGVTAREQPLIFMTSTAGKIREDIYDEIYEEAEMTINGYDMKDGYSDERSIFFIYELDKREEWMDEKCWKKANPGLGTIKNFSKLKDKVDLAKQNPRHVKNIVCKEFNIRETSTEAWLTFDALNNKETFSIEELKPKYGIGGVDLSATTDLTAAKVIFMVPNDPKIYVIQMYWLPEDTLEQRVKDDRIPYDTWRDLGYLRVTPGNTVDHDYVADWFVELRTTHNIYLPWIGYDSWGSKDFVKRLKGEFGEAALYPVIQGPRTFSYPMKLLAANLESKMIIYNNNPIDKWCLSNTTIEEDKNTNIRPIKTSNQRRRIDGTLALLDAYVVLQDKMSDYVNMI